MHRPRIVPMHGPRRLPERREVPLIQQRLDELPRRMDIIRDVLLLIGSRRRPGYGFVDLHDVVVGVVSSRGGYRTRHGGVLRHTAVCGGGLAALEADRRAAETRRDVVPEEDDFVGWSEQGEAAGVGGP